MRRSGSSGLQRKDTFYAGVANSNSGGVGGDPAGDPRGAAAGTLQRVRWAELIGGLKIGNVWVFCTADFYLGLSRRRSRSCRFSSFFLCFFLSFFLRKLKNKANAPIFRP